LRKNACSAHRESGGGRLAKRRAGLAIAGLNKTATNKKLKKRFHSNTYKKQKYPFISMLINF
jgi:hypothetical protein